MVARTPVDVLRLIAGWVVEMPDGQRTLHSACLVNSHFHEAFMPLLSRYIYFQPPLRKLRQHGDGAISDDAQRPCGIDQNKQTELLAALSVAPELNRTRSLRIVLYSDPNDPIREDAVDVFGLILSRMENLTSLSVRISGDPLGTERAICSLQNPEKIRNLEILTQYDPWSHVFGPIPRDFLATRCSHEGSKERRRQCLEAGRAITLPCRHRFDFNWFFLAGFHNLHHLNLQGLSGNYIQTVGLLVDMIMSSPDLVSFGLGDSATGFADGVGGTLIQLRYDIIDRLEKSEPARPFWEAQVLATVRSVTLGYDCIPEDYNEWDSVNEAGDLGLALDWLLPCCGRSGMDSLTVHNTMFDTESADQATSMVWVRGKPYAMMDNPWRNFEHGLRSGLKQFQVDVLTLSLCQLIETASGNRAFLPGWRRDCDSSGRPSEPRYGSVVVRPDSSSFVLQWRHLDTSNRERSDSTHPFHHASPLHYWWASMGD